MIKIITDSVASIPQDMLEGTDIEVITLYVNREGTEYADATMDLDAFYAGIYDMVDNIPTSSQPSQLTFEECFERAAKQGDKVVGIFISTGLSGCYEGALRAARAVKTRNLDFEYAMIDSQSCGFDEAWAVFDGAEAVKADKTFNECVQSVLTGMASSRFIFTPESLTFLQKGGRIGNVAALVGNLIKLSPVLTVIDGKPETYAKVRTRKKALDKMMQAFKDDVEKYGLKNVVVHYIGDKSPAVEWAKNVVEPYVGRAVRVLPVSPVIGLHVGPAVGIAYECKQVIENKITGSLQSFVCTQ